jgi:hypothetical protein
MRYSSLLLTAVLAFGCSSKKPTEDEAEIITRVGLIIAKEDVNMEQVEKDSKVRTTVYGSVSSGSGVSIGLGFLLSPLFSSEPDRDPVRYEIDLKDGGQITVYHESQDFEVDDCVEITIYPDEEKNPPAMKRDKGGC